MSKILIIEDDPRIASAMRIRFESEGYEVFEAADVIAGETLAARHHPDLICLDIGLSAGSGLSLAEAFRLREDTRLTPIIFVTASKDPDLRRKAMKLGAAGLL